MLCMYCRDADAEADKLVCARCNDTMSPRSRFTWVQCEKCGVESEVYKPRMAAWKCPCTWPLSEKVKHFNKNTKQSHPSAWVEGVAKPSERQMVNKFLAANPPLIAELQQNNAKIRSRCSKYRTTVAWWLITLAKQDGQCAICRYQPNEVLALHVDHDHESGDVRGLLCGSCNTGLGLLKIDGPTDVERASAVVQYIRTFRSGRKIGVPR